MRAATTIDVTYTGNDEPFIDRLYGTRLTFEKGQTRALLPDLAARFLRHVDVFKGPDDATAEQAQTDANTGQAGGKGKGTKQPEGAAGQAGGKGKGTKQPEGAAGQTGGKGKGTKQPEGAAGQTEGQKSNEGEGSTQTGEPTTPPTDDTAAQLAEAQRLEEENRRKEQVRFELHMSIDTMTKAAVRDFVKANFKQELPDGKVADMRAQAKSMVDQFGTP